MPATLPWPKMAKTPAKIGTVAPSTTVRCAARKRTRAWAIVRRIVVMAFLPETGFPALSIASERRRSSRLYGSRHACRLRHVFPGGDGAREFGGHRVDGSLVRHGTLQPGPRGLIEDGP